MMMLGEISGDCNTIVGFTSITPIVVILVSRLSLITLLLKVRETKNSFVLKFTRQQLNALIDFNEIFAHMFFDRKFCSRSVMGKTALTVSK